MSDKPANRRGLTDLSETTMPDTTDLFAQPRTRTRTWDRCNRAHAFRGIPPNTQAAVRAVANNHTITVDQAAQALLSYALSCIWNGTLKLEPVLEYGQSTLFPNTRFSRSRKVVHWSEKSWGLTPPKKKPHKVKQEGEVRPWRDWPVVAYRLEPETLERLSQLWKKHQLRRGEFVSYLLQHSLDAYESGKLVLEVKDG